MWGCPPLTRLEKLCYWPAVRVERKSEVPCDEGLPRSGHEASCFHMLPLKVPLAALGGRKCVCCVSYCCCYRSPHIWWIMVIDMDSFTV